VRSVRSADAADEMPKVSTNVVGVMGLLLVSVAE